MRRLLFASLRYYRGVHALVIGGVAVAVAVLAGALLVGASVRASLRELALTRLGNTDVVIAANSFFRAALSEEMSSPEIQAVAPLLAVPGAVVHEESRRTAGKVQVFGIDERFLRFHGREVTPPGNGEAWISPGLATELAARIGDSLLLRVARASDIPLSHLQGRRDEASERVRVTVTRVAPRSELGEFSLGPSQGPTAAIFVSLSRLQRDLAIDANVNTLLVQMAPPLRHAEADVRSALGSAVTLADVGLRVRNSPQGAVAILESRTGLLPDALWQAAAMRAADQGGRPSGVLTHLANAIRANGREIPYSLIAATDQVTGRVDTASSDERTTVAPPSGTPPIWLNDWALEDLGVSVGERVEVDYYIWSDQDGLQTRSTTFVLAGRVGMDGAGGDATFTPDYPGITDAADVTSWDPPFPIDMSRVRKKDEEYWDRWRGAPKAFIPLAVGQGLWPSPFGSVSSLRTSPIPDWPALDNLDEVFSVRDVRRDALAAADGTTDFGEYFIYFSFFLVVAGLLLAGMFFALSVEQRAGELGLLAAVGYSTRDVRRLLFLESAVLGILGSVLGVAGAVGYAAFIMYGLRTWWVGAVNTTALRLHVDPMLLALGAGAALVAAVLALVLSMRRISRRSARTLLTAGLSSAPRLGPSRIALGTTVISAALAMLLVAAGAGGVLPAVAAFFAAGALLMVAGCAAFAHWLTRFPGTQHRVGSLWRFGADYARWRPTRSVLCAALIAFACFVIVAVGAFRRDSTDTSLARDSGTGGFALLAEAVAPLMHNPNTPSGRDELSLSGYPELEGLHTARLRLRPGDEASCLTLYQPKNPRLVAPEATFIAENRFAFAQSLAESDAERANPWLLLERRFADGAIPAIADQTSLTYVFHLQVGDDFVMTPEGADPIRLRIVATLADSMLQSELIIGEPDFVRLFPSHEGYRLWLIEMDPSQIASVTTLLEDRLADFGVDVIDARERLASYHQVENTYLSTFQVLGALGLLLGTIGLAAVLARNVLERRRELGLLGAVGFTAAHIRRVVTAESLVLVVTGVLIGTTAALVSIAPAVAQRTSSLPFASLGLLLVAVVITGVLASLAAVRMATSVNVVAALKAE